MGFLGRMLQKVNDKMEIATENMAISNFKRQLSQLQPGLLVVLSEEEIRRIVHTAIRISEMCNTNIVKEINDIIEAIHCFMMCNEDEEYAAGDNELTRILKPHKRILNKVAAAFGL